MRGYKGMASDMTCRGMQYEVGKSYHVDGEIVLCENGLHFCKQLINVFGYYPMTLEWLNSYPKINRYFEIEATGIVVTNGDKSAASDITILRELTIPEIIRCIYDDDYYTHAYLSGDGSKCSWNGDGCGNSTGYGRGNGYGDGYECNYEGYGYGNGDCIFCDDGDGRGCGYEDISQILVYQE